MKVQHAAMQIRQRWKLPDGDVQRLQKGNQSSSQGLKSAFMIIPHLFLNYTVAQTWAISDICGNPLWDFKESQDSEWDLRPECAFVGVCLKPSHMIPSQFVYCPENDSLQLQSPTLWLSYFWFSKGQPKSLADNMLWLGYLKSKIRNSQWPSWRSLDSSLLIREP